MKKNIIIFAGVIAMLFVIASQASAHVVVKPNEVGIGARMNFVVSVPTEEADPTVQVRLVIPEGVQSVRPNVKPGWNIELKKTGEGEEAKVTEIIWSGGSIPAEQRDEFIFSSQAPAEETTLIWKAYQTYGNGNIVAWENSPETVGEYTTKNPPKEGEEDHNAPRPYSETKVVDDLKTAETETKPAVSRNSSNNAITVALVAIVMSAVALGLQYYKKK